MIPKPMLATAVEDIETLTYPCVLQPKYDGIRCLVTNEGVFSRTGKRIPNDYIFMYLSAPRLPPGIWLDGELILEGTTDFNQVQSAVMSKSGTPDFRYVVFDMFDTTTRNLDNYFERRTKLLDLFAHELKTFSKVVLCPDKTVNNLQDLEDYRLEIIYGRIRYEGFMSRNPLTEYKHGRSTPTRQELVKHKDFFDGEAKVVGYIQKKDKNGDLEEALGAFKCRTIPYKEDESTDLIFPANFDVGTGFTEAQRRELWLERDSWIGRTITYEYQNLTDNDVPRFPVFKHERKPL